MIFRADSPFVERLRDRMRAETGTRLVDWVDHIAVTRATELNGKPFETQLLEFGYEFDAENEHGRWYVHHRGLFVPICLTEQEVRRLVVAVDAVDDFLAANDLQDTTIEGLKHTQFRRALIAREDSCEFWVCERRGYANWSLPESQDELRLKAIDHAEAFKLRRRRFADEKAGFAQAADLIRQSILDLGVDWTCDLFFAAERAYWQRRNLAARVQRARQDRLGLGWANHDHHTYRSSRKYFADLIAMFEMLGFRCRERFYAGQEAGWGAQVLEQPGCGMVIFADVDLTPEELAADLRMRDCATNQSEERWGCGVSCMERLFYRPGCIIWSAPSILTPLASSWMRREFAACHHLPTTVICGRLSRRAKFGPSIMIVSNRQSKGSSFPASKRINSLHKAHLAPIWKFSRETRDSRASTSPALAALF